MNHDKLHQMQQKVAAGIALERKLEGLACIRSLVLNNKPISLISGNIIKTNGDLDKAVGICVLENYDIKISDLLAKALGEIITELQKEFDKL